VTAGIVIVVVSIFVTYLVDPSTVVVHPNSTVVVRGGKEIVVFEGRVLGGRTKMQGGLQWRSGLGTFQIDGSTNTTDAFVTEPLPAKGKYTPISLVKPLYQSAQLHKTGKRRLTTWP
jgi:hypothetical protein